ncbi:MAG: metallophosphoesterase, partial [Polyangiaceae bacterium]|nr:metallophosphoesterase [Polyangiaceae bacterium]
LGTRWQLERRHFRVYAELMATIPHFPSLGDHDYNTRDGAPYLEAFELPRNGDPDDPERYYSFDWGPIHFVALDTRRLDERQERWLAADLEATEMPFIVVYGHHAPYASGAHGSRLAVRARLEPHLARHGVQLMLAGHEHHYERTHGIEGVTYVVTGGGGRGTRPIGRSSFTAFAAEVLHFVYLEYDGSALVLHAIDATGQEFDNHVLRARDER